MEKEQVFWHGQSFESNKEAIEKATDSFRERVNNHQMPVDEAMELLYEDLGIEREIFGDLGIEMVTVGGDLTKLEARGKQCKKESEFELFIEFDEESILYDELERNLELNLLF